jgi:hypothetical protein
MKILIFLLMTTTAMAQSTVYIDQVGNNNNVLVSQTAAEGSTAIILNNGDGNNLSIRQDGIGLHSAFIGTPPSQTLSTFAPGNQNFVWNNSSNNSNNIFTILQTGSGNKVAAINLDSTTNNNNNTASIVQGGNANKSFALNLSGSGISATVVQDNQTTPDAASMSITCLAPPCSGYTYTKH